jgi:uncharacterized membrane protein YhaH (DUF805 family)
MTNIFSFEGKSDRLEYWFLTILGLIYVAVLFFVGFAAMTTNPVIGIFVLVAGLILLFWTSIAVVIKRCRDCGLHPLWILACFIPYIGIFFGIVLGCLPSENKES